MGPGLGRLPLLMMPLLHVGKHGSEHSFPFNVAQRDIRQLDTVALQRSGVGVLITLWRMLHACSMFVDEGNHLHL